MTNGKKILLNIIYGLASILILCTFLYMVLLPGIPKDEIGEGGETIATLTFPNGKYTGESIFLFLNGQGKFEFDTGEVYEGSWKLHKMNGTGKLTSTVGVYDGEFKKSLRSGSGTFTWVDGSKYVPVGKRSIKRRRNPHNGFRGHYKGTFLNNAFHNGVVSGSIDGDTFSVEVSSGALSDKINITFSSGVTYIGKYNGTFFDGKGTMVFPNIGEYSGNFKNGKRDGDGIFTWNDGASYDGKWENDVFHGDGKYIFNSTTSISGTFEAGKLNGTYTYKNADGEFKTVWKNGVCSSVTAK